MTGRQVLFPTTGEGKRIPDAPHGHVHIGVSCMTLGPGQSLEFHVSVPPGIITRMLISRKQAWVFAFSTVAIDGVIVRLDEFIGHTVIGRVSGTIENVTERATDGTRTTSPCFIIEIALVP